MPIPETGSSYWRSLEQLADAPSVRERIESEFVGYDPATLLTEGPVSRRRFMKLMGASMALAGLTLTGCRRWPTTVLAPYAHDPKGRLPGVAEYYATAFETNGVAHGVLAQSYDGRPIKIEGNPTHPFARSANPSIGAADAQAQASVLSVYDPDRSRGVIDRRSGSPLGSDWESFGRWLAGQNLAADGGVGLAIVAEASYGPSYRRLRQDVAARYPNAALVTYEPFDDVGEREGTRLAFGRPLRPVYHLERADVVVCFDADPLGTHPAAVRYMADWVARRRSADQGQMSRVYAVESAFTITGTNADYRLPVRPSRVPVLLAAVAAGVGVGGGGGSGATLTGEEQAFVDRLIADLQANPGRSAVMCGETASPQAHALAAAMNAAVGTPGVEGTVHYVDHPGGDETYGPAAMAALAQRMRRGEVRTLLILGGNPVYNAPADADFARALRDVPGSIHLSHYDDETSAACRWHLPRAHYLEAWGDAAAWDGTVSIVQPLILPLFDGRSVIEVLSLLSDDRFLSPEGDVPADPQGLTIVRDTFGDTDPIGGADFRQALHAGVVPRTASEPVAATANGGVSLDFSPENAVENAFEVRFQRTAAVHDGRFANNGWLQEMPDPVTKLVWDNAALVSVADARRLGVVPGDGASYHTSLLITAGGRTVEMPAFVLPGQPTGVIGLPLGYGRTRAGHVGGTEGITIGFDTYRLRTTTAQGSLTAERVTAGPKRHQLVTTQVHHLLDAVGQKGMAYRTGEPNGNGLLIREATLGAYRRDPQVAKRGIHALPGLQLFNPPHTFAEPHAWGMSIDMTACTGCSACVVACQAENNVPIVGKAEVYKNREMHWLRVDRYFKGDVNNPDVVHQPMMCVHCENAPCEQVCPVAATVHDTEGLNTMVYNRCIGTRYCSNNCPYKVRRFNYFDYHSRNPNGNPYNSAFLGLPDQQQQLKVSHLRRLAMNPDVTVRMRGVMEKCTYCTQRIKHATQRRKVDWTKGVWANADAEAAGRPGYVVEDGDVVTACQQACPTQAIVFGDLLDGDAAATRLAKNPRAYSLLDDLNTRPRTKYLARIRNRDGDPPAPATHEATA